MLPEIGQIAMILALLLAIGQSVLPLVGAHRGNVALMDTARSFAHGSFLLLFVAFVLLTHAFIVHDFSVAYVAQNSNTLLPLQYRFSAVWGGHEGSLLLWVLILAGWGSAVARFSRSLPLPVVARVLAIMGIVSVGFLLFTILTSNPFDRLFPVPPQGSDLNPLLQDPGLIFHPPMLYMGYVGFAVAFSFAIAALIDGKVDARWVRWSRPWTNVAWAFLTLGITLGSWWAYYELGWGGWWFWDPVENASFMPWLVGAALIHSQAVTEKRGSFRGWTLLLAIAAFSLSLLGAFLVRSGVLTSVHAFASDPERGIFILAFLVFVVGGSLLLYALRAPRDDIGKPFEAGSRETFILVNNLLLAAATAMVLIGTLFPLFADALDLGKFSVGPPYFGVLFTVLMLPLVLVIPFGPLLRWQRDNVGKVSVWLLPWAGLALLAGVVTFFTWPQGTLKTAAGVAAGVWVAAGTLRFVWNRWRQGGRFTPEMTGMIVAHLGVAVFVFGVLMLESLKLERDVAMRPGSVVESLGYRFEFQSVETVRGPNYIADRATVIASSNGREIATLHPERRMYKSGGMPMTETAISSNLVRDLYIALAEPLDDQGSWAVRVHVKPFVRWIWLGAVLMAVGGFIVAMDKRFRPKRREEEA